MRTNVRSSIYNISLKKGLTIDGPTKDGATYPTDSFSYHISDLKPSFKGENLKQS